MIKSGTAELVEVLERSVAAFARTSPSLLSIPDNSIIEPIEGAIRRLEVYQTVAGQVLLSGNGGTIVQDHIFSLQLFFRAQKNPRDAADWLVKILSTKQTDGRLVACLWGVSIDASVQLSTKVRLMPFDSLPDSPMKSRVHSNAKDTWNNSAWMAKNYFQTPATAYVLQLSNFPYIGDTTAPFAMLERAIEISQDYWTLIEGVAVGHPIVVGYPTRVACLPWDE